jgi:hypothetical protein
MTKLNQELQGVPIRQYKIQNNNYKTVQNTKYFSLQFASILLLHSDL